MSYTIGKLLNPGIPLTLFHPARYLPECSNSLYFPVAIISRYTVIHFMVHSIDHFQFTPTGVMVSPLFVYPSVCVSVTTLLAERTINKQQIKKTKLMCVLVLENNLLLANSLLINKNQDPLPFRNVLCHEATWYLNGTPKLCKVLYKYI